MPSDFEVIGTVPDEVSGPFHLTAENAAAFERWWHLNGITTELSRSASGPRVKVARQELVAACRPGAKVAYRIEIVRKGMKREIAGVAVREVGKRG